MDQPQATPATNDDFQALYEFFSSHRDSELARRIYLLADRLRDVTKLEQAADEANHRVQVARAQLRELEAKLAEVRGQIDEALLRREMTRTLHGAHERASQLVADAERKAREILEAAGREARQREAHLNAGLEAKRAEHDTLHKGIADAKAAIKTSIPASERLRR